MPAEGRKEAAAVVDGEPPGESSNRQMVEPLRFAGREAGKKRRLDSLIWYLLGIMRLNQLPHLLLLLAAFCLLLPSALARDLYVGETPLAEGEDVTPAALLRTLDQVLVRLTGMVDESPVARLGLGASDVRSLLQSQQRVRLDRLDESGNPRTELRLRAEFYSTAVDDLLQRHQLPRLGQERPAILLWVAVDAEGESAELADDPLLEQQVRDQARRYGLDVIRPLGDAMDMAEVRLADIRGGFIDAAVPGAQRYGAGVAAMLDLREQDGYWTGRWTWRLDGRDGGMTLTADSPGRLIELGMQRVLEALASRYAVLIGENGGGLQRIIVEGIVDPVQYAEVLSFLGGLSVVQQLRVVGAQGRQVEFELALAGGGLDDAISLSRILIVDRLAPDGRLYLRLQQ